MSITLLRTLVAIAERGSFQAAADQVCVSPAAVSQQMRTLEDLVQAELFDRSRRTPQLTRQGLSIIPKARDILHAYDEMIGSLRPGGELVGDLTIGAVSSSISNLVPRSIKELMQVYPAVHIKVVPDQSHELLLQIDRGDLDAAIMSEPDRLRSHLKWQPIARETMMLICARDVTGDDVVSLLRDRPYIRMSRQAWVSELADDLLQELKLDIRDAMELDTLESVSRMVAHDLGVAIIPLPCLPDESTEGLRFLPVGNPPRDRVMGILSRQDSPKFKLIDRLWEAAMTAASE